MCEHYAQISSSTVTAYVSMPVQLGHPMSLSCNANQVNIKLIIVKFCSSLENCAFSSRLSPRTPPTQPRLKAEGLSKSTSLAEILLFFGLFFFNICIKNLLAKVEINIMINSNIIKNPQDHLNRQNPISSRNTTLCELLVKKVTKRDLGDWK